MKLPRRTFLHLAAGAAALTAVSRFACAQAYPTRPVRLIVPFGPAGATDITARLIGQWLSERLGQQFVIENRPGAGSNIGTEAVVRAAPDGYTLGLFGAPSAINATLYEKLNFNFIRDITPVASIIRFPNVMVVNPSVPATTVPEFIAYAKANPGKLNMASPGNGSTPGGTALDPRGICVARSDRSRRTHDHRQVRGLHVLEDACRVPCGIR
jgi:tripartite-type tricarboxylate transporter receptor subunit TctC